MNITDPANNLRDDNQEGIDYPPIQNLNKVNQNNHREMSAILGTYSE